MLYSGSIAMVLCLQEEQIMKPFVPSPKERALQLQPEQQEPGEKNEGSFPAEDGHT